jgi:glycine dehydrogenase subunit 1
MFEHPYLPQTPADQALMLKRVGVKNIDELFEPIPDALKLKQPLQLPPHMSEMELKDYFQGLADKNKSVGKLESYLGAGAYEHFSPSVVRHLVGRSEFYTAYTPYQPEMTQGVLQAIFEYQSCVCALTGMDVSNASLYEGGHALAEACLMARAHAQASRNKIVLGAGVHPEYVQVLRTYTHNLELEIVQAPLAADGRTDLEGLKKLCDERTAAVVVANPNFFGCLEDGAAFVEAAHAVGALAIAAVEPVALALLKSPGDFGADIACGEGQSLGLSLSFGGPWLGFIACKQNLVRRMPGRICGITTDNRGQRGFVLTLQTREQHIRREKANSNICTNQTLLAIAATIYLGAVGPQGLVEVAEQGLQKAHYLADLLGRLEGLALPYRAPFMNEFVIKTPKPSAFILRAMQAKGILAGVALERFFPDRKHELLVCVTETKKKSQLDRYAQALKEVLA